MLSTFYIERDPMFTHDFGDDCEKVISMLVDDEPFALGRYGDGELSILRGDPIGNAEFQWDASGKDFQDQLTTAFRHHDERYFAGICCPCCVHPNLVEWQKSMTGRDDRYLTYNNIFVNANYPKFLRLFANVLVKRNPIFFCNTEAKEVEGWCKVSVTNNAWRYWDMYIEDVESLARDMDGQLFLFAAGPLSEVLIYYGWKANPSNTYVDIGSVLDPLILGRQSRRYLMGGNIDQVCRW